MAATRRTTRADPESFHAVAAMRLAELIDDPETRDFVLSSAIEKWQKALVSYVASLPVEPEPESAVVRALQAGPRALP